MAGKAVGRPFFLRAERTFEGNRFAHELQQQAFDCLLLQAEPLDDNDPKGAELLPADFKEGVAA